MPGRRAVVVLGMHRSGTSALTRALSLCGLGLPANLIPASRKNERGYFESQLIYQIHEELLASAGSSWFDPNGFPVAWFASDDAQRFETRMADALRAEFGDTGDFVLKDPRACRLVPFWLRVLAQVGATPLFVFPIRDPFEVAASLRRSEGVAEELGRWLWLTHLLVAERDTREHPRCFVTYTDLLHDWRSVIERIERELGVRLPRRSEAAEAEIDAFLTPELRHQVRAQETPEPSRGIARSLATAHRWALDAGKGAEPDRAVLDDLRASIEAIETTIGPLVAAIEHQRREGLAEVSRLEETATLRERELAELRASTIEAREATLEARRDLATTRDTARMLLRWAIERGRGDEPLPASLRSALDLFQESVATDLPAIAAVSLDLTERRLEIDRLEADRLAGATQLETLTRRLGEIEDALRERERVVAEQREQERVREQELAHVQASVDRLERALRAEAARRHAAERDAERLLASCGESNARAARLEAALAGLGERDKGSRGGD